MVVVVVVVVAVVVVVESSIVDRGSDWIGLRVYEGYRYYVIRIPCSNRSLDLANHSSEV